MGWETGNCETGGCENPGVGGFTGDCEGGGAEKSGTDGVETGSVGLKFVWTGSYVDAGVGVNLGTDEACKFEDTGNFAGAGADIGAAPPIDIIGIIGGGEIFSEAAAAGVTAETGGMTGSC